MTTDDLKRGDLFARQQLALFIRLPLGERMIFSCQAGEGQKIIRRMRVRLAKLKKKARKLNRVVNEFKMLVESIEYEDLEGYYERVTLLKSTNSVTGLNNAIAEIMDEFEGLTIEKKVQKHG